MRFINIFVFFVSVLAGCAAYTTAIQKTENPKLFDSYVYGRFSIDSKKQMLSGYQTMGFSLDCGSNNIILIKFTFENEVQVIKLPPAPSCFFKEIVYTDSDGIIKTRKPAPAELSRRRDFPSGKAYYLGDYFASTTTTVSGNMIRRNWSIEKTQDAYESASIELKKNYPAFALIGTEKRLLGQ
jgi:hypothetical protein